MSVFNEMDEQKREWKAQDIAQVDDDFRWLMKDARGRRVYNEICSLAGVYGVSRAIDPVALAMQAGARDVGLRFMGHTQAVCPPDVIRALAERADTVNERRIVKERILKKTERNER